MNQISILKLIPVNNFLLRKHRLMFTIIYEHYLYSVSDYYLFLLMILLSYLPVSISIYLTNRDTLLSSFRLFQRSSANSSISSGIATSFGSPSKLGRINQKEDSPMNVGAVKELIDAAIAKSQGGIRKFKRNVSKKRIDRDGYIVLYEKDFTK